MWKITLVSNFLTPQTGLTVLIFTAFTKLLSIIISDPVYIKASKASAITDLKSGVVTVEQLRRTGDAFTNVTQVLKSRSYTDCSIGSRRQ